MSRTTETLTPPLALQQVDMPAPHVNGVPGDAGPATKQRRWVAICSVEDIPRLGARVIQRPGRPSIALFRTAMDTFFALDDRCPHRGGPLSQGIVYGDRVACPLHNTNVHLDTGCAVAPDKGQVQSYAVKIDEGMIYVDLAVHPNGND